MTRIKAESLLSAKENITGSYLVRESVGRRKYNSYALSVKVEKTSEELAAAAEDEDGGGGGRSDAFKFKHYEIKQEGGRVFIGKK